MLVLLCSLGGMLLSSTCESTKGRLTAQAQSTVLLLLCSWARLHLRARGFVLRCVTKAVCCCCPATSTLCWLAFSEQQLVPQVAVPLQRCLSRFRTPHGHSEVPAVWHLQAVCYR